MSSNRGNTVYRNDENDSTPVGKEPGIPPVSPFTPAGVSATPKTPENTTGLEIKGLESGNLRTIPVLGPHPRHAESDTLG